MSHGPKAAAWLVGAVLLTAPSLAPAEPVPGSDESPDPASLLPHGRQPEPGLLTGGQPSEEQIATLVEAGYHTFINLRTKGEPGELPEEVFERHGGRYVHIPIAGASGLTDENVALLDAALKEAEGKPTVLYCGSSNRVGALLALRARQQGKTAEEALAFGRAAGMTSMEGATREKLGLPAE